MPSPGLSKASAPSHQLSLLGEQPIAFNERADLTFNHKDTLPLHSNGMSFVAFDGAGAEIVNGTYYSVGGGFVVSDEPAPGGGTEKRIVPDLTPLPLPFRSGDELLVLCEREKTSIAGIMRRNERAWRSDAEIDAGLLHIWHVMQACVKRGCETPGVLPGGYKVKRRAPELYRQLTAPQVAAPQRSLDRTRLGESVGAGGERGERRGWPRGDGADQRRRGHRARADALLRALRAWRE